MIENEWMNENNDLNKSSSKSGINDPPATPQKKLINRSLDWSCFSNTLFDVERMRGWKKEKRLIKVI